MTKKNVLAVACTLAIAFIASFGLISEAFAAIPHAPAHAAALMDVVRDYAPHIAVPLLVLRADLEELQRKAAAKLAELQDDTAPDVARTIQADHTKLLDEIAQKRAQIQQAEEEEAAAGRNGNATNSASTDASRAAEIHDIGTRAGMAPDVIQAALRNGTALDAFRAQAFDHLAQSQSRTSSVHVVTDEQVTQRAARIEALSYQFGAPMPAVGPSAAARSHMGHGLISLAVECTGYRGYPRNARDVEGIFERAALTTSDFPIILEGSINRTLETRYALARPTYRQIARRRNFRDFRPHTSIKTGDFPMLERVLEDGEIKYGKLTEGKESLSVLSYAKALSISRQLMINDDLGAIQEMLSDYGSTVALFEEIVFYTQALNGKLNDGNTVFHASHSNLAGAGAAIDVTTVSAGRAGMAKQKSIDGNALLQNTPSIILTGPDTITAAEMLVASITPATVQTVNIFSGRLTPMDTAQISGNAWYLFSDPAAGSNYRWGYLDGYEAPRVRIENPFGRQGMSMSVEHDFGCGAVDYRYGWKNPGA